MSGYTDAFETMMTGNITGAVTDGYVIGAGMDVYFYVMLMFILTTGVYLKSESFEMTGLTIMVLAGAGLMSNIVNVSNITSNINMIALFGMIVAFAFTLIVWGFLSRRE